jgi:hypothetical protein
MARTASQVVVVEGAGRAVRGVLAHANAQAEPLVGVAVDGARIVLSAPGASSLVYAILTAAADAPSGLNGSFQAPSADARLLTDGADLELGLQANDLRIAAGKRVLKGKRLSDAPVEVEWVWPSSAADVELTVRRDALLDALPDGEGVIRFDGLDKQLVIEAPAGERRLGLANRPRRRKPVGTRIAFDRLRLALEPHDERVVLGLTDGRPLTVRSETVRSVLSPLAPEPRPAGRRAPAERTAEKARRTTAKDADGDGAERRAEQRKRDRERRQAAEKRREEERRKAEQQRAAQQERARARAAARADQALERAASQLEAAAGAVQGTPLEHLKPELEDLRSRIAEARRSIS